MSKPITIYPLYFFLFFSLLFYSCEKEDILINQNISYQQPTLLAKYKWSSIETAFFNTEQVRNSDNIGQRSQIHTGIVKAFNKIAKDNEEHHFVDDMVQKLGIPYWLESQVAENGKNFIVFTPLFSVQYNEVTSYFVTNIEGAQIDVNLRIKL